MSPVGWAVPLGRPVGIVPAEVDRLAELANPLAERTGQLGEALGAEHHQRDDREEKQVDRALDSHF